MTSGDLSLGNADRQRLQLHSRHSRPPPPPPPPPLQPLTPLHSQLNTQNTPPSRPWALEDMCEIDNDPYLFLNKMHPFAFGMAAIDEMAFRGQWHQYRQSGALGLSTSPPPASLPSASSGAWRNLPRSTAPLVLMAPTQGASHAAPHALAQALAQVQAIEALPHKRKASAPPDSARRSKLPHHAADSGSDHRSRACCSRSASADSGYTLGSPELITPIHDDPMHSSLDAAAASSGPASEVAPTWTIPQSLKVTIDHAAYPDVMNAIIAASSREVLYTLYNTSRGMRARVAPMLEKHVVLSLRAAARTVAPVIDLQPYQSASAPWASFKGWEDPKPVDVSCGSCDCEDSEDAYRPNWLEMPTFNSAASEARLSPFVRSVLRRAAVIDLEGHLRLPPRLPTLATPDVLRVHIPELAVDEYQRVDSVGWDEHTLKRFTPRSLVVLSRLVDYRTTDTKAAEVAVAPTCTVNDGTEHLVLRVAYDPADPRLPRSTIRVPTMYRPGLPASVKRITMVFVPSERVVDESGNDSSDSNASTVVLLPVRPPVRPLGMLNSTASWVAGYLPRGVQFTFVGVEGLPASALNLVAGPGRYSTSTSASRTQTLIDSAASLTTAIRNGIVKQRRLTKSTAINAAMENLSTLTLAEYECKVGKRQFALETTE